VQELPIDARDWPARSAAVSEWLTIGVNSFHLLSDKHGSLPTEDSLAWTDRHTFQDPDSRLGPAGSWFALLTMGGAAEMLKGVSALYASASETPLTRAHIPVARSLQEHLGRVVWLCAPAFSIGPESQPDDTWELRHFRSTSRPPFGALAGASRSCGESSDRLHRLVPSNMSQCPGTRMVGAAGF
jgi:hypothetical protein